MTEYSSKIVRLQVKALNQVNRNSFPHKDPEETHSRFWVIIRRCHGRFIDAMAITKDMKIADVLKKYPSSKKVFEKHIPQCPKCGGAAAESIGRGARQHGIDPEMLVAELNRAARPRKKK